VNKRHRGRPPQPLARGPVIRVNINLSRPEALALRAAAKRAHLPVATYVRSLVVPIALNALADQAVKWNAIDRIQQQTKVAEQTFNVD
jgi:hypothetical protein